MAVCHYLVCPAAHHGAAKHCRQCTLQKFLKKPFNGFLAAIKNRRTVHKIHKSFSEVFVNAEIKITLSCLQIFAFLMDLTITQLRVFLWSHIKDILFMRHDVKPLKGTQKTYARSQCSCNDALSWVVHERPEDMKVHCRYIIDWASVNILILPICHLYT